MKFSLIIPVYNIEKYILKCLTSIYKQNYNNYEVIIVNDGSLDNSEKIINDFIKDKKQFKLYTKVNGGLSDARNYGVTKAKGDYLIFIDGDDYIENNLLQKINKVIDEEGYDVIRYGIKIVDEKGTLLRVCQNLPDTKEKEKAIDLILSHEFVEPAWAYAYKKSFWLDNDFKYPYGKIHEDFGLTPIVLSKAKSLKILNYNGYNYVQRENSIMSQVSYEKLLKRTNDFIEEYFNNINMITEDNIINKKIKNFCTGAVIYKLRELNENDCKKAIAQLKKTKFLKNYNPTNNKERLIKIYYKFFINQIIKKNRLKESSKEE